MKNTLTETSKVEKNNRVRSKKELLHQDDMSSAMGASLWGHIQIARADHWFKNVFVFPGVVVAIGMDPTLLGGPDFVLRLVLGLVSICLVASSNYVVNEVLDAPHDRQHPTKCKRPVPSGKVNLLLAYVQWIILMVVGIGIALQVSIPFAVTMSVLWVMGCVYNIPPVRSKDLPYLDVLSEAVNNPLRMLAGWYIAGSLVVPPTSLLLSYWMIGCYFMGMKRFAEYRHIDDPERAAAYRKSFSFYTEPRLLVSVMFYGSAAMLFFGSFLIRYRFELILSFPVLALVMATYLSLAFKEDSAVQRPEGLYREPTLMAAVISCTALMATLMFIDIPLLHEAFHPSLPVSK